MTECPKDWGFLSDIKADKELRQTMIPIRSTCKVCMADLAGGDPHESWCTLKGD